MCGQHRRGELNVLPARKTGVWVPGASFLCVQVMHLSCPRVSWDPLPAFALLFRLKAYPAVTGPTPES